MAGIYITGDCEGEYKTNIEAASFNSDTLNVVVTELRLIKWEEIEYYNKEDLQSDNEEYINPSFIENVTFADTSETADFANTIIVPINIIPSSKLDDGLTTGKFKGTFYGTMYSNTPAVDEGSGETPVTETAVNPFNISGCFNLLWKLLLWLLVLFLLLWLLGKGCEGCSREPIPIPCDTVVIRDTIFIRDTIIRTPEFVPQDTLRKDIITNDTIITLYLYDCGTVDGDKINLYVNRDLIAQNLVLTGFYQKFDVVTTPGYDRIRIHALETPVQNCTVGIKIVDSKGNVLLEECLDIDYKKIVEINLNY
jgi:hypothetical protein